MTTPIYTSLEKRKQNFLNKSKLIHNNKYSYDLVDYKHSHIKIKIICNIHGEYIQIPSAHLQGQGCKKCQYENQKKKYTYSRLDFIKKAKAIHNNKYDYSLVKYINSKTKVKIICPEHGIFEQIANNHLNGLGCRCCTKHQGFINQTILYRDHKLANKLSTLYIIKHENLIKVGITIQTIQERFNKSIEIIQELNNIKLIEAFNKEQSILSKYSIYKEKPSNWNKNHNGETEFLNISFEQQNQIIIDYFS